MDEWLELENKNGRLSDLYGFHAYMSPASKWSPQEFTPEKRFEDLVMAMVWEKNKAGWNSTPWMNTETGFLGGGPFEPTDCPRSSRCNECVV